MAPFVLLKLRWATLAVREQRAVRIAAVLVCSVLVWSVLLAPAIRVLKKAESQRTVLDAHWESMQKLQLRARALQSQQAQSHPEVLGALQGAAAVLGPAAQWTVVGERATLTVQQVPADLLAQWLAQGQATVQPFEAHLVRDASTKAALQTTTWSGTVVYPLPP